MVFIAQFLKLLISSSAELIKVREKELSSILRYGIIPLGPRFTPKMVTSVSLSHER